MNTMEINNKTEDDDIGEENKWTESFQTDRPILMLNENKVYIKEEKTYLIKEELMQEDFVKEEEHCFDVKEEEHCFGDLVKEEQDCFGGLCEEDSEVIKKFQESQCHANAEKERNTIRTLNLAGKGSTAPLGKMQRKGESLADERINPLMDDPDFGNESEVEELSEREDNNDNEDIPILEFGSDQSIIMDTVGESEEVLMERKGNFQEDAKVRWVTDDFASPDLEEWNDIPRSSGSEIKSPYEYFRKYVPNNVYKEFAEKTNIYYMQKHGKSLGVTSQEIQQLFGIHVEIGSMGLPQLRIYWSENRRHDLIGNTMTFNRFCVLRNNLHIVDNLQHDQSDTDKVWKVRPFINYYAEGVSLLEREKRVCVGEQMIPFKGTLSLKQYIKGKSTPWGIKVFFLCGESGLPYNFLLHQGRSTKLPEEFSHLGIGGSIVMSLVEETLEPFSGFKIFFDNFFTSTKLIQELAAFGIYGTGTVRSSRVGGQIPIMSKKEISKKSRGAMDGCVSDDKTICLVRWHDNATVQVLSSAYDWKTNEGKVLRWDKIKKEKVEVPCPQPVIQYNRSMRGVDKLDFLLALYRIHVKSKKWTLRVIFHFVDLAVTTSWLEYKRDCKIQGIPPKEQLSLLTFRFNLSETLINYEINPVESCKAGRPKKDAQHLSPCINKKTQSRPHNDIRMDGIGHLPSWNETRERCKAYNCSGKSYITCMKCKISLCLNKDRNCFTYYHSK